MILPLNKGYLTAKIDITSNEYYILEYIKKGDTSAHD